MTRVLSSKSAMRKALALSFSAHAAICILPSLRSRHEVPPTPEPRPAEDRWSGTTADLPGAAGATDVYDVSLDAPPPPPAPAAPAPPASPPVIAVAAPAPRTPADHDVAAPSPPRPRASASSEAAHDAPRTPPRHRVASKAAASDASPSAHDRGGAPGGGGTFGAEGPASVRDLGRAFTRAIPPASQTDPIWAAIPLGDAGTLKVSIRVDASGHIASAEPLGKDPPKALVSLVRRTIPLLEAGTYAVRDGAVTEGSEILELHAVVSQISIAADDPSGIAPIGLSNGGYARGVGTNSFTQIGGRHVEVKLKVLRVETR